jgi:hypothetical protein
MINRNRMIFFNTAYMKKYQGHWNVDRPINGGSFIADKGWGGEVFNFQPYQGMMYGYVEPGATEQNGQRNIGISRLIKSGIKTVSYVSGVLIIWVARPPKKDKSVMVGWYENATLHRASQRLLKDQQRVLPNGHYPYFAKANESDCYLIPVGDRTLTIPRGKDAFGQSNIWYADGVLGEEIKDEVIDFINRWKESK